MKKIITVCLLATTLLTGCAQEEPQLVPIKAAPVEAASADTTTIASAPTAPVEHTRRVMQGRYYAYGEVITSDGNEWSYEDPERLDGDPVYAVLDDNGTPEYIYDDIVVGVVYDRETAIYDALESELSGEFQIEREGNVLRVSVKE
jgi:hypothetical protein